MRPAAVIAASQLANDSGVISSSLWLHLRGQANIAIYCKTVQPMHVSAASFQSHVLAWLPVLPSTRLGRASNQALNHEVGAVPFQKFLPRSLSNLMYREGNPASDITTLILSVTWRLAHDFAVSMLVNVACADTPSKVAAVARYLFMCFFPLLI